MRSDFLGLVFVPHRPLFLPSGRDSYSLKYWTNWEKSYGVMGLICRLPWPQIAMVDRLWPLVIRPLPSPSKIELSWLATGWRRWRVLQGNRFVHRGTHFPMEHSPLIRSWLYVLRLLTLPYVGPTMHLPRPCRQKSSMEVGYIHFGYEPLPLTSCVHFLHQRQTQN